MQLCRALHGPGQQAAAILECRTKTHTALSTETHVVHIHVALAMLHLCSAGHEDGMRGVGGIYGGTHYMYMDASLHLRPSN